MNTKKEIVIFFSLEWKKLILPLLLILLFGYQLYVYCSMSKLNEAMICKSYETNTLMEEYRKNNNTELLKQTFEEFRPISEKFIKDMEKAKGSKITYTITTKIYPFFPVPCEFILNNFCRYYINKETYDCLTIDSSSKLNSLFKVEKPEYKPVSIFLLAIHFLILFIIGYLISSLVLFVFRNIKIKR